QVADAWNQLFPSDDGERPITHKHISYWEAWPGPTGRAPTPDVLNRLARIYHCAAADLLDGEDHSHLDPALTSGQGEPVITGEVVTYGATADPSDVVGRVDAFIAGSGSLLLSRS